VTEFWSSVGQNLALYEKYKAIAAGARIRDAVRRTQEDPR
jgi:Zn-dependent oligopeptidase